MDIELRFFATFREAVGQKTIEREFDDDATIGDILAALEDEFDGLNGYLLDDQGDIRPNLSILLNGQDVVHKANVDTPVTEGDKISVFPPVAGGHR